jgi:hypothetical protein
MRTASHPFAQSVPRPSAHRHLAARVIDQAFRDARNSTGASTNGASARAFLSGSPMLSYWCAIAEVDPTCVIVRARTLTRARAVATPKGPVWAHDSSAASE